MHICKDLSAGDDPAVWPRNPHEPPARVPPGARAYGPAKARLIVRPLGPMLSAVKCPACSEVMAVVERERVELDFCPECSGIWFDSEELETLLRAGGMDADPLASAVPADTKERKRRCPRCRKHMLKLDSGGVIVDSCPAGDGLWLDRGELAGLVKGSVSEEKALEFLSRFFGGEK